MATWGYVRCSSKEQNEARQVEAIKPFVTTESHLLVEKQSGKNFDRPIYLSLKNIMREGDTLVIKSLDRLGRNYEQMKDEWKDLCDRGIKIKILDTPLLDTDKFGDELMGNFVADVVFNVLSFVSEHERKNIKQRQKEGIEIAKKKGIQFGRPSMDYPDNFSDIYEKWKKGKIRAVDAMNILGLKKTTFYNMAKKFK